MLSLLVSCKTEDSDDNCTCFEEFVPQREDDHWVCIGTKHRRRFRCGEEKPPLCICTANGNNVTLDIGETRCTSKNQTFDGIFCSPMDQWDNYFRKYPFKRIVFN